MSGCAPTKMFSATLRSGNSVGSWKMIAIPAVLRLLGVVEDRLLAVEQEPARVRPVDAREDLDERGLPRAVLADEAVHLAAEELNITVLERVDGAEALLRVLEDEDRRLGCAHGTEGAPRFHGAPDF